MGLIAVYAVLRSDETDGVVDDDPLFQLPPTLQRLAGLAADTYDEDILAAMDPHYRKIMEGFIALSVIEDEVDAEPQEPVVSAMSPNAVRERNRAVMAHLVTLFSQGVEVPNRIRNSIQRCLIPHFLDGRDLTEAHVELLRERCLLRDDGSFVPWGEWCGSVVARIEAQRFWSPGLGAKGQATLVHLLQYQRDHAVGTDDHAKRDTMRVGEFSIPAEAQARVKELEAEVGK
jgi:hypothetical protein